MPERQLGGTRKKFLVETDLSQYSSIKLPWKSIKFRAHTDDFSSILWEDRWSKQKLIDERARYVTQGLGDVYSQEYLNVPLDESNTFFRRADFLPRKDEDKKRLLNYYVTADLAISQRERSDYSVFAVAGTDEDGLLHLVKVVRDRMDSQQIVDTILLLQKMYRPILFGVEAGTIQKSIGPFLNKEMLATGIFVPLVLLKPSVDKITRARSIQARMRAGACKFDKDAEWYQTFEEELMRFPRDRHDDQVDSWAYMGLMLDKMMDAPTQQEQDDEDYTASLHDEDSGLSGRSSHTGY
jgi:predicted phage terminase large subunit-like protein